jgi:signal recognition particle subunit SRP54
VMFASTGEKLSDFDLFHPDRMATRILDMGDVLSLIERAEKAFDAEQTASIAERMMSGEGFTLEDFVEQLQMLRKLGPLKNILGMMPGASKNKALLDQVNDKDLDRAEAIVRSMTPAERRTPKMINGSRRLRIANGSGVTVGEVSQLVTNFFEGQKQMKMLMGGGMPGMPGIPGMGGGARRSAKGAKAAKNAKGKRRSGDPRKSALGPAGGSGAGNGAPAGAPALPAAAQAQEPQSMEELAEMLQQAQSAGGAGGFGGQGGEGGFPGFGNPANVPQFPAGGSNVIPAAFGRRNKKKK